MADAPGGEMSGRHHKLAAETSLLLFITTVAIRVRSYFVIERVGHVHYSPDVPNENHHLYLQANHGVANLTGGGDPAENFSHTRWDWRQFDAYPIGSRGA